METGRGRGRKGEEGRKRGEGGGVRERKERRGERESVSTLKYWEDPLP